MGSSPTICDVARLKLGFALLAVLWLGITQAAGDVVRVCSGCSAPTLAEAVRQASPGDTIIIEAGHYPQTHVVITKPLTIMGRGRPVLDGGHKGTVITVQGVPSFIRGLVIANTGFSSLEEYAAVKLIGSNASILEDITTQQCAYGIILYRSPTCVLSNIRCYGTGAIESLSGNGVHLWKSPQCVITRCFVTHHRDGLYFEFSRSCSIESNEAVANMRYGLHFMFSDSNVYRNNVFRNNGAGVAVMYSHAVRMADNVFADNWGPSSYGLLLKDITYSIIENNTFDRNTVAVYMEGTNNTSIVSNAFRSNGWALKVLGNCIADSLIDNVFVANTFDVMTNAFHSDLYCNCNYWDQYRGYDLNHDGYGDVPFRPVSVFSILVERLPLAVVLLRSLVVELMVYLERAIPSLIPVTLVDVHPRMVPHLSTDRTASTTQRTSWVRATQ